MKKGNQRVRKDRDAWHVSPEQRRPPPPKVEPPKRVKVPAMPPVTLVPEPGSWLWTCRAGFEAQLWEELAWGKKNPFLLGPALVTSAPFTPGENPMPQPPTFARMGFLITDVVRSPADAAAALPDEGTKVQVWVPDTDVANARAGEATAWADTIAAIRAEEGLVDPETPWKASEAGAWLGQICLIGPGVAVVGRVRAREALNLAAGGRARMKRAESPSRAAMKLDEALDWLGISPGRGDLCVDLGSAPGGWTRRLVERGARVWSVDPANLSPDVLKLPRVKHFQENAFEFSPDEPVDWLFCDMAWRPLDVSQLLGKWARNSWAAQLVANIKLPMKDKLPTLFRVKHALEDGGWKQLRMRQLYHDRDEITVTGRRV